MDLVKKLVGEGITLIATLHSPTPFVFNLFDKICLLLRGHIVYFGRRDRAIAFFEPNVPADVISADSDAEWLTDVIVKADAADKAEELASYYEQSPKKEVHTVFNGPKPVNCFFLCRKSSNLWVAMSMKLCCQKISFRTFRSERQQSPLPGLP